MHLAVKRAGTITSAALLIALGVGGGVASADDTPTDTNTVVNSEPPQETDPADTGLVDVPTGQGDSEPDIPGSGSAGGGNQPGAQRCEVERVYTPTYKGGDHHKGVGAPQANTNNTSHSATSTFTAEVSGTVGVSYSGSLSVSANAMIGKIEAKYDVSLSASMTAKLGNSMSISTPAHKITHASYGVYRLRTQGTSYVITENCKTTTKSTVTSYTPHYVGWYIWESNA
ncbi:hypothetical protein [Streptomyces griseofuscus]|uniref:hypothetical protein n=1 Tax=Streptomyces griseofuscus TaxID=146922 RepID=UPI00382DCD51